MNTFAVLALITGALVICGKWGAAFHVGRFRRLLALERAKLSHEQSNHKHLMSECRTQELNIKQLSNKKVLIEKMLHKQHAALEDLHHEEEKEEELKARQQGALDRLKEARKP